MTAVDTPSSAELARIAEIQTQRERETHDIRQTEAAAARTIQKTYRGYRTRRQLNTLNVDASLRWIAAVREARFRNATRIPGLSTLGDKEEGQGGVGVDGIGHAYEDHDHAYDEQYDHEAQEAAQEHDQGPSAPYTSARIKWRRATAIARRANYDPDDALPSSSSSSASSLSQDEVSDKVHRRRSRAQEDARRRQEAVMMKMDYFLEMVDLKHRYGSSLRSYHAVWREADTQQNFFYWLDHGDGRDVELPGISRERLEREQVRYLSRDERQYYLVKVDGEGRLCWAKNGERIDTTTEFRDSVRGIVRVGDPTPSFTLGRSEDGGGVDTTTTTTDSRSSSSGSGTLSPGSEDEEDAAARYPAPDLDRVHGLRKLNHLSVPSIVNRLMRRTVRKNTWIFVADTSFRLYVGIKESGAFQHSSFLQGSRISAAGLVRISDGQLRSLSPLSGHYCPPASSFRAFVSSLRASGVDTSRVSISKAYVVLLGLEAYVETKQKGKRVRKGAGGVVERVVHPERARKRREAEWDGSESAARERAWLTKT
jgi:hypothetical protein